MMDGPLLHGIESDWTVRPMTVADHPFVLDSWLRSYANPSHGREAAPYVRQWQDRRRYFDAHRLSVTVILNNPYTVAVTACSTDAPDAIIGYAVGAPGLLHYVYVKAHSRKGGVATKMLAALATGPLQFTTHEVERGQARRHGLEYRPELLWRT